MIDGAACRIRRRAAGLAFPVSWSLAAIVLAACAHREPPAIAAVPAPPPRRVVCLAPSHTETLVALGLGDRLVGISDYCPELPPGSDARRIGGLVNPNVEAILALRPDLVMTVQNAEDRALATLRRRGVAIHAKDPQSLEEVFATIRDVGALFAATAAADELVATLRARIDRVARDVARRGPRPRVYVEVDYPACWTIGRRTFVHDALTAAGGDNVFGDVDQGYLQVSKEEVLARKPDWVLMLHPVDGPLSDRRELAGLAAVQEGRTITDFDRDALLRSSPRLVGGIEQLAARLAGR